LSGGLRDLIARLGPSTRKSLERAVHNCVRSTHFAVELEHLMLELLRPPAQDWRAVLRHYGVDAVALETELQRVLEALPRGCTLTPSFRPAVAEALQEAWVVASIGLGASSVRSGAVLLAILARDACRSVVAASCPMLLKVPREHLAENLKELLGVVPEDSAPGAAAGGAEAGVTRGGALDLYTVDMSGLAQAGALDPAPGRESEIRQLIDILMRRRQNNPILTGEPGVGKTAIVEGFAQLVAAGHVPERLRGVTVRTLDIGLLQAGAGVKGEFEQRLKSVISEVASAPVPVILFVDEAHTLIGAGAAAGQGDAANLLKPALARGELRTIAATTWAEYKRYFEKDAALARRFQVVKVAEPDDAMVRTMLRSAAPRLESHHRVRVTEEAIEAAAALSSRYISGRQQPDKAMSVLDTACARVAVAQDVAHGSIADAAATLAALAVEGERLRRESREGRDHPARLAHLAEAQARVEAEHARLTARWVEEREAVRQIRLLMEDASAANHAGALQHARAQHARLAPDAPALVPIEVDGPAVADVVASWTGIPVGQMLRDEMRTILDVEERLGARVVGQDHATAAIARRLRTWRAGLAEPGKPPGVFMLCGPTGVGKTETAAAVADLLYGGERGLIVINMSEFQEPHTVALLKGAPPGYVGYGQGGVLTEAVRRRPYCVVLLDEIEKAHPDVTDLFYRIFDKGLLEDAEGIEIDFRHAVIIMTTNLGAEAISAAASAAAMEGAPPLHVDSLASAVRPDLLHRFKPAFLARCTIVPYLPLGDEEFARIIALKLDRVRARFAESHRAQLSFAPEFATWLLGRCLETAEGGARMIDQVLESAFLPRLSSAVLERIAEGRSFRSTWVCFSHEGRLLVTFEEGAG
jgi:type VI secretion system protein VasG